MIQKKPANNFFRIKAVKTFVLLETACLIGSYAVWSFMSRSQDCRYYMYQYCPPILNGYYYLYEKVSNDNNLRLLDLSTWKNKENAS